MGLSLCVGMLADLLKNDEEGAAWLQNNLQSVNEFLASKNLKAHVEPRDCKVFSCDMFGYSGLHYLRRLAAHLDLYKKLPEPGDESAPDDKELEEYFDMFDPDSPPRAFDHLILHSDAEGFYLPQDFDSVLFPPESMEIPGGMIGSCPQLKKECERIAKELELPLDTDPESDELLEATEDQGQDNSKKYLRYGIESYSLLNLYNASVHAIETGAALVFT
ncbi:MAG TPA: hypothetical protein V6C89_10540 [Drouetiella sp.]|jgi:hypothetical protein